MSVLLSTYKKWEALYVEGMDDQSHLLPDLVEQLPPESKKLFWEELDYLHDSGVCFNDSRDIESRLEDDLMILFESN